MHACVAVLDGWMDEWMDGWIDPCLPSSHLYPDCTGHSAFRGGQYHVVEAALQGRDVFVLMPTGPSH